MRLTEVLRGKGHLVTGEAEARGCNITGLNCDSRKVEPGFLFAAIPGTHMDGKKFIPEAIQRGAIAVLGPIGTEVGYDYSNIPLIVDEDPRRLYALMAARFFQHQPETIAAITGTSGKTSTSHFLRQIWNIAGWRAAAMGTLGLCVTDPANKALLSGAEYSLTTPDPVDLHQQLCELWKLGVERLAMEASSHGLDQRRLEGVRVSVAAFTNLSHDHLDYHRTEAEYLLAKLRLFDDLLIDGGTAVVNADQFCAEKVISVCQKRDLSIIRFGVNGDRVCLTKLTSQDGGQQMSFEIDGQSHQVLLPLIGGFQASNALCAASLALATGTEVSVVVSALSCLQDVPGRMQLVGRNAAGGSVYVDYAHKPDALRHALQALRHHTCGKLIVLFGCGGDRDIEKRPEMGRLASELADKVFITDDNPRGERPADIRNAVVAGCPKAVEIGNRGDAIAAAMETLTDGDVLLVAGKGHETGQIVGEEIVPFDDTEVVRSLIRGGI